MAKQYKCCSVSPFDVENNDYIPIIVDRFSVVPGQCQLGIPPHCLKGDNHEEEPMITLIKKIKK